MFRFTLLTQLQILVLLQTSVRSHSIVINQSQPDMKHAVNVIMPESHSGQTVPTPPQTGLFSYQPLSQNIDCTRLIQIKDSVKNGDPIVCEMTEALFQDKPKYEALSYMWGDSPTRNSIIINGNEFKVKQNLYDALQYLRKRKAGTLYWIDALCINQDDAEERNRQVRIMHHIYTRATTVVVWLGKAYEKYEESLPDLEKLGHVNSPTKRNKLEASTGGYLNEEAVGEQGDKDIEERNLAKDLYRDGYWSRIWIIQEIGLARQVKVCFGNSAVNWDGFIHFMGMHNVGSDGPIRLHQQRQNQVNGSSTLRQLLQNHKDALCKDRKDKVYGLIGLARDGRGLVIDYQRPLFQIWTDVMEFMNSHRLFEDQDILSVGGLVKFLLMGTDCPPLEQILAPYAPGEDSIAITNTTSGQAFELPTAILGCVARVGPRPCEVIGCLDEVDQLTRMVQATYRKGDLRGAHRESSNMIRAILDIDETVLSRKCFDCSSRIQWRARFYNHDSIKPLLNDHLHIREHQSKSKDQYQDAKWRSEQPLTANSRIFLLSAQHAPWKMGLASRDIQPGDFICWLAWPRRAIILRPSKLSDDYSWDCRVTGTAVVTDDLHELSLSHLQRPDWDKDKVVQTVYLDASMIFTLLA